MKNTIGRDIPDYIENYGEPRLYSGSTANINDAIKKQQMIKCMNPEDEKLIGSINEVLMKCGLEDGMTISFHHHFRNGDKVLNMVMEEIVKMGIKDLKIAASSIFPVHQPLVKLIEEGIVTGIYANYMSGPVAEAISDGKLKYPAIMHTHGGRARAIESGDLKIDIAFLGAPTADCYGNINGVTGPSACGTLGYAVPDAMYAVRTVAITDHLVEYPACPIEICQDFVDYVVSVESIGDPDGIVSGTTKVTSNPIDLKIAKMAADVIEYSGLLKDGFSFQTGAGGTSLAVAAYVKDKMKQQNIKGSFAAGGITKFLVDMLEEGLFKSLLDVQCFDRDSIESYGRNANHQAMSASMYGNPHNKGAVVNKLDVMILGATEVDLDFNVNVTTSSNGDIMGGSGGHSDTAAGSKLAIVVTKLIKARLPIIVDKVTTVTTPGETVDIVVTERGIAVNPNRKDLIDKLADKKLPLFTIEALKDMAETISGVPKKIEFEDRVVGIVEYRDGTVIDVIRKVMD